MTAPATPIAQKAASARRSTALATSLLALPVVAGLAIMLRTSVNIPFEDDYDAIGEFLEHYIGLHSPLHRLGWVFTAQHVDYKLIFLQIVVALQYTLTGHLNFRVLQLLGDLSVPATALLLWLFLARSGRPLADRLWLFSPPCFLVFSLCYFEGLNWATSGLQSLAVVAFALAAILFFTSPLRFAIVCALLFLTLAVFASANGFLVSAAAAVLLLRQHRYRALIAVVTLTLGLAALYAVHLHAAEAPIPAPPVSLFHAVLGTIAFPLVFLGAAAAKPALAVVLGLAILAAFYSLARRNWIAASPATFSAALFCMLTAAGVALTRHTMGAGAAIAGRYRIYSALMLTLLFLGALEVLAPSQPWRNPRWRSALTLGTALCALAWLASSSNAYRHLMQRRDLLTTHLIRWERDPQQLVLMPDEDPVRQLPIWVNMRTRAQQDVEREVNLGLYIPPYFVSSRTAIGDPRATR